MMAANPDPRQVSTMYFDIAKLWLTGICEQLADFRLLESKRAL